MNMEQTIQRIYDLTQLDLQNKTFEELFACPAEEIGELARELKIEEKVFGNDYKSPDEGSKAEAVDLFIGATCMYLARGILIKDETVAERLRDSLTTGWLAMPSQVRSVFEILWDAAKGLSTCHLDTITARAAMEIFFQRMGTADEFIETISKKLDKWEGSQKGLLAKK
jgi:hypothetical protein